MGHPPRPRIVVWISKRMRNNQKMKKKKNKNKNKSKTKSATTSPTVITRWSDPIQRHHCHHPKKKHHRRRRRGHPSYPMRSIMSPTWKIYRTLPPMSNVRPVLPVIARPLRLRDGSLVDDVGCPRFN